MSVNAAFPTENTLASSQERQTKAHPVNAPPESPWSLGNAVLPIMFECAS